MNIIKYYEKIPYNNNIIILMTFIIVIGFMITDSFFKPKINEGMTICITPDQYKNDNNICVDKKPYGSSCNKSFECNNQLKCINKICSFYT